VKSTAEVGGEWDAAGLLGFLLEPRQRSETGPCFLTVPSDIRGMSLPQTAHKPLVEERAEQCAMFSMLLGRAMRMAMTTVTAVRRQLMRLVNDQNFIEENKKNTILSRRPIGENN
jgi:hypothetical protein